MLYYNNIKVYRFRDMIYGMYNLIHETIKFNADPEEFWDYVDCRTLTTLKSYNIYEEESIKDNSYSNSHEKLSGYCRRVYVV